MGKHGSMMNTLPQNLQDKIISEPMSGCWLWTGALNGDGYGNAWMNKKPILAHKATYQICVGEVPKGMELDHSCKVRSCVNPHHVEPVTHQQNVLRGSSPAAVHAIKTHCPKGHPYSGENLKIAHKKNGMIHRRCFICARAAKNACVQRKKVAHV